MAFFRIILLVGLRSLYRQPRRTALALIAVAGGIIALLLASGFIEWVFQDLRESTIRSQLGHLQIVRPGYPEYGRSDPFRYLLPRDDSALRLITAQPAVVEATPRLRFAGLASHADDTVSFVGEGIVPSGERALSRAISIVQGTDLTDGDADGVIFGEGLARNLGVSIGDSVVLVVNTERGNIGAVELTIRGTFSSVSKAYDDAALRVPIETVRKVMHVDGAHEWVVLLRDTGQTPEVLAMLQRSLPVKQFQVLPWYDLADFYHKTVALFSRQLGAVRLIIAVIIALSIVNTMMMNVMERTREIGTSMALGVTRSRILAQFVCEGVLLGMVGGIAGVAVGWALALSISAIGIPMPPPPGMAHGYIGQILVTPRLAGGAFALALVTTAAASVYPAWKASRLAVVDALRHGA